MKTAILVSGVYRPESVRVHIVLNELSEAFPDTDVYFHTWDEHKHLVPDYLNVESCPEPTLNYDTMLDPDTDIGGRYNYIRQQLKYYDAGYRLNDDSGKIDISKERLEKFISIRHSGTKQILGHADLYEKVKKLNKGYDRYIRTRWDVSIQENVDFTSFLRRCKIGPIGFATPAPAHRAYPKFRKHIRDDTSSFNDRLLFDHLIIHHKDHFDPQLVYKLHKDKQLLPAEWGWYQVMVKPYDNNHKICQNGAGVYRNYEEKRKNNEHR